MLRFTKIKFCILFIFLQLLHSKLTAQRFVLEYEKYSDSTLWYIKNTGTDTIKATSFTLNWFHMKPTFLAWTNDPMQPFFNIQTQMISKGLKYTWKYKTTYGCSIKDTLFPNSRIMVAMSVNYDEINRDTIMPANASIFVNKTVGFTVYNAIPAGSTCDFKRIYTASRADQQGIHWFATAYPSMTQNSCEAKTGYQCFGVPINPYTLKQTPSTVMPTCPGGRMWTSYGYPIDSQLYYDAQASDSSFWSKVIDGLDSGDYFVFISHQMVSNSDLQKLATIFTKVGADKNKLIQAGSGANCQFSFIGRKNLPQGKANYAFKCYSGPSLPSSFSVDHVMVYNQPLNELQPYPECYEKVAVIHEPYIPEIDTTQKNSVVPHATQALRTYQVKAYPNPSSDNWQLSGIPFQTQFVIFNIAGKMIYQGNCLANQSTVIDATQFTSGMYFIKFITPPSIQIPSIKLLKP